MQENLTIARRVVEWRRGEADELWTGMVAVNRALNDCWAAKSDDSIGRAERLRTDIVAALGELGG
jgi:hypothetical protein